jgi:hypothetical protein
LSSDDDNDSEGDDDDDDVSVVHDVTCLDVLFVRKLVYKM